MTEYLKVYKLYNKNLFNYKDHSFFESIYRILAILLFPLFKYLNPNNELGTIDIFDFAMERVIQLTHAYMIDSDESEIIWNGRNDYGDQVDNGVYFCRLSLNNKYYWDKLAVINGN